MEVDGSLVFTKYRHWSVHNFHPVL